MEIVRPPEPVMGLSAGATIPAIEIIALVDADTGVSGTEGRLALPAAFVFLSPGCPACKDAIPTIEALFDSAERAGLNLHVLVDGGSVDGKEWLGTSLGGNAAYVTHASYRRINPHGAVPSYLFVDESGVVEAGGYIGDEDWQALVTQLTRA